jgi:hypothetical protein
MISIVSGIFRSPLPHAVAGNAFAWLSSEALTFGAFAEGKGQSTQLIAILCWW